MECRYNRVVWNKVKLLNDVDTMAATVHSIKDLYFVICLELSPQELCNIFMLVWELWCNRDNLVWNIIKEGPD